MKGLIWILLILNSMIGLAQSNTAMSQFEPIKFKENIELDKYVIRETYKINDTSYVLIGTPKKYKPTNEGLRIIYLIKKNKVFEIDYVSPGVGESYIYRPSFFQGNNKTVIVCEIGAEYSWGMDVFLLQKGSLIKLGNINVAAEINEKEYEESAIPLLKISDGQSLKFKFSEEKIYQGKRVNSISLFYKPGQSKEEVLPVTAISYEWNGSWTLKK